MTTIAYRDGTLAVDSRGSCGGWVTNDQTVKIMRAQNGTIYAWSGELAATWRLVQQIVAGQSIEKTEVDARIIVLPKNGDLTVIEENGFFPHPRKQFAAWGSGFPAALAALHMGASPKKAVEIASLIDSATGGNVVSMRSGGK